MAKPTCAVELVDQIVEHHNGTIRLAAVTAEAVSVAGGA
jgi:hypothetical protein